MLGVFGPNELKEKKTTTALELLIGQFKSILVTIFIIFAALVDFIPFMWTFSTTWMATGDYELAATTTRTITFTSLVFFEFFLS